MPGTSPRTYLITTFRDKERVKALGARWDPAEKRWYVPGHQDITSFAQWLPDLAAADAPIAAAESREVAQTAASTSGISLTQLLDGVAAAVAAAIPQPVWVRAEVVNASVTGGSGHVYLELTERTPDGRVLAQARASIWRTTADAVLPAFQKATGMVLGPGIKLLMLARPSVHPVYGLSLTVEELDASYSLGDLAARRREIRLSLQQAGVFDQNKRLTSPWIYRRVLVIAPPAAAGLGDFRAEADRLQHHGLCEFIYAYSRFQGEGAAQEIVQTLQDQLSQLKLAGPNAVDAVVIIRGGGAVNDLAWLEHEVLVRAICLCPLPVLTGIGHERDQCLADEVAHQSFDTPSKVIAGIRQLIVQRTREAADFFNTLCREAQSRVTALRQQSTDAYSRIERLAQDRLHRSQANALERLETIRSLSRQQVHAAKSQAREHRQSVQLRAERQLQAAAERTDHLRQQIGDTARRQLVQARDRSEGLLREIIGQGPQKTLTRGFALIRAADTDIAVTSAQQAAAHQNQTLRLEFHDGHALATLTNATPTAKGSPES